MATHHLTKPMAEPATTEPPVFLTREELCNRWKVSLMFIHRLRLAKKLPAYKIGGRGVRFSLADVLKIESKALQP